MPRIEIGSLTGFLLGELSNAYIMERMKVWSRDKYMWLKSEETLLYPAPL
ncbi:MAG: VUT family protein [Bacteroidaceae bacterium]|nr:VUT family protein [Bacteroidaceae bacterium]